ncbi:peptidoglycan recognition protein family protein [Staphylococcus caeli]|uniref:peptidoglycan recognition protein family protein n=1 Tax=Staphylococcus caeli TaxID=2201815 RepID=UPI003F55132F
MEHIYSKFYKQHETITACKPEILGVVLHDDAENYSAKDYIEWLQNRIEHDELEKGWACVYIDKNTSYWFHPSHHIEWHCGHTFANEHYIGIERCQSKIGGVLSDEAFMQNEEASFKIAAMLLQKYKLPVNRTTVKLHKMFYDTECPARAWAIHLNNAPTNQQNMQRLQDYFIERIKAYDLFTEEELAVLG